MSCVKRYHLCILIPAITGLPDMVTTPRILLFTAHLVSEGSEDVLCIICCVLDDCNGFWIFFAQNYCIRFDKHPQIHIIITWYVYQFNFKPALRHYPSYEGTGCCVVK
jgi:hypothetical protein